MGKVRWGSAAACAMAFVGMAVPLSGQQTPLEGAWIPTGYVLADGVRHAVDGRIFFTGADWTVLFFVIRDGEARRGSAEGGTFEVDGDRLVFSHLYHLSAGEAMEGLPESPLRMNLTAAADAAREDSRFQVQGDRLIIDFPSGNRMEFRRSGD